MTILVDWAYKQQVISFPLICCHARLCDCCVVVCGMSEAGGCGVKGGRIIWHVLWDYS